MKRIAAISLMVILMLIPLMGVNCGSDRDTIPPVISGITVSCTRESAVTISWATDELATGDIEYGPDISYGYYHPSPSDTTANVNNHSWLLNNLSPDIRYHFRIKSADDAGNEAISWDYNFTTKYAYSTGVAWNSHNTPSRMEAEQSYLVSIDITNTGKLTWPTSGAKPVMLFYHWKTAGGDQIIWDGPGSALEADVAPGESTTVNATVTAPSSPGSYILEWDMIHEGITWFSSTGCSTLDVVVTCMLPGR